MSTTSSSSLSGIKACFFDIFGTTVNWGESIPLALREAAKGAEAPAPFESWDEVAREWRDGFFVEFKKLKDEGDLTFPSVDTIHLTSLHHLLSTSPPSLASLLPPPTHPSLLLAWHAVPPWPDMPPAFTSLASKGLLLVALANGSTSVLLSLARKGGLKFDLIVASDGVRMWKPDPEIYRLALKMVGLEAREVLMVASHAYDLEAAQGVGIKTAYIERRTEDVGLEDYEERLKRFDLVVREGEGGMGRVEEVLLTGRSN